MARTVSFISFWRKSISGRKESGNFVVEEETGDGDDFEESSNGFGELEKEDLFLLELSCFLRSSISFCCSFC